MPGTVTINYMRYHIESPRTAGDTICTHFIDGKTEGETKVSDLPMVTRNGIDLELQSLNSQAPAMK